MSADKATTEPRSYISPRPVFTGGVLHRPGEPFTTNAPPGTGWELLPGNQNAETGSVDAGAPSAPKEGPGLNRADLQQRRHAR